jgi:hypothetical protein
MFANLVVNLTLQNHHPFSLSEVDGPAMLLMQTFLNRWHDGRQFIIRAFVCELPG